MRREEITCINSPRIIMKNRRVNIKIARSRWVKRARIKEEVNLRFRGKEKINRVMN